MHRLLQTGWGMCEWTNYEWKHWPRMMMIQPLFWYIKCHFCAYTAVELSHNCAVIFMVRVHQQSESWQQSYIWWFGDFSMATQIARFMWPTWGPPGSSRPQICPMLAPWTLISVYLWFVVNFIAVGIDAFSTIYVMADEVSRVVILFTVQQACDAMIASCLHQNDVATSFWRNNDVIIMSCVHWEAGTKNKYLCSVANTRTILVPFFSHQPIILV